MEEYTVTVATGTSEYSGTNNYIYITLMGENGNSERTILDNPGLDFCRGAVDEYKVCSPAPLGRVILVRLEKQRYWVEDNWFCLYVTVAPPGGGTALTFPCNRWLIGNVKVELQEGTELSLKKLAIRFGKSWDDLDDFKRCFWKLRSPIAEYCMEHWKEDWFFGYQCLNGSNPRMIQRCKELPGNFPVSGDMVQGSLTPRTTLEKELKYIAAPLCLLYEHPDQGLIPIAIQLGQTPGLESPIFLPKDPPLAWLLAKIWVRHSEFQVFQLLSHLLRTHLVVEVFCVATLRQLPAVHPVYKVVSTGGEGLLVLAQNEYKVLTYRSLQPYWDFQQRGATKLRKYFYREYSLMLWDAIHSFVSGIVSLYYHNDRDVTEDTELQAWIKDIAEEGFFDWCAWVPNTPCTMRHPPPTDKDSVTMELIMDTLPDVSQTCLEMAITWHLGRPQPDAVPLGQYREQYFTEPQAQE
ncbi:unnamed protein product, partial [Coregonus sp. 'balchen']